MPSYFRRYRIVGILPLLLFALSVTPAMSAEPYRARLWSGHSCGNFWNCAKDCCPDNYCPKPVPCVKSPLCFQCDTYCPKPLPCVQSPNCFECDRYCRKPFPIICCPCEPGVCGPGSWCK